MLRIRPLWLCLSILALVVSAFIVGRAGATQLGQLLPRERNAAFSFPKSWGEPKNVTTTSRGFAYFFVTESGTIRVVQSGPAGIEDIEVIGR